MYLYGSDKINPAFEEELTLDGPIVGQNKSKQTNLQREINACVTGPLAKAREMKGTYHDLRHTLPPPVFFIIFLFIFVIESMMDCDKTFIVFSLWASQKGSFGCPLDTTTSSSGGCYERT